MPGEIPYYILLIIFSALVYLPIALIAYCKYLPYSKFRGRSRPGEMCPVLTYLEGEPSSKVRVRSRVNERSQR